MPVILRSNATLVPAQRGKDLIDSSFHATAENDGPNHIERCITACHRDDHNCTCHPEAQPESLS